MRRLKHSGFVLPSLSDIAATPVVEQLQRLAEPEVALYRDALVVPRRFCIDLEVPSPSLRMPPQKLDANVPPIAALLARNSSSRAARSCSWRTLKFLPVPQVE